MLKLNNLTRRINARFNPSLLVEYEFGIADAAAYFTCMYENADGLVLNKPHATIDLYEALAGQNNTVHDLLTLICTCMNLAEIEMSL